MLTTPSIEHKFTGTALSLKKRLFLGSASWRYVRVVNQTDKIVQVLLGDEQVVTGIAWSAADDYVVDDVVTNDGSTWQCIQDNGSGAPKEPGQSGSETYWKVITDSSLPLIAKNVSATNCSSHVVANTTLEIVLWAHDAAVESVGVYAPASTTGTVLIWGK